MTSRRKDVRIRRSTADRMVKELQERILEINSDDRYAYKVGRAVIFGSYVNSDCDTLGDIDVGYLLEKRFSDRARHDSLVESIRRNHRCSDWLLRLAWPMEEVIRRIRNRSGYISLHPIGTKEDEAIFSKEWMELEV